MKFSNDVTGVTFHSQTKTCKETLCVSYDVFRTQHGVTVRVTCGTKPAGQYRQAYEHGKSIAMALAENDAYIN